MTSRVVSTAVVAVGGAAVVLVRQLQRRVAAGEISTEHLATHVMPLDQGPQGYQMFKNKQDGCVRAVFQPTGAPAPRHD
jgi:threonine dehydrogenase-like Zn-dependent dehydrogenase